MEACYCYKCREGSGLLETALTLLQLNAEIRERAPTVMLKGRVAIVVERCKGCGFCVEFCPTKVLVLSPAYNAKGYHPPEVVAAEKCSGCDLCGMYCPDFAIHGWKITKEKETDAKVSDAVGVR